MPTFQQLARLGRIKNRKKCKTPDLRQCPQRSGICIQIKLRTPKKPNSAKRKTLNVNAFHKKNNVIAYAPGEDNGIMVNAKLLFGGGHPKDLPGIRYKQIPGKYNTPCIEQRKKGRSKYGVSKPIVLRFISDYQ